MLQQMNVFNNSHLDKSNSHSKSKNKQEKTSSLAYDHSNSHDLSSSFSRARRSSSPAQDRINNYLNNSGIQRNNSIQRRSNQSFEGTLNSSKINKRPPLKPKQKANDLSKQQQNHNYKRERSFQKKKDILPMNYQHQQQSQIKTLLKDIYGFDQKGKLIKQDYALKKNKNGFDVSKVLQINGQRIYTNPKFDKQYSQNNKSSSNLHIYENSSFNNSKRSHSPKDNNRTYHEYLQKQEPIKYNELATKQLKKSRQLNNSYNQTSNSKTFNKSIPNISNNGCQIQLNALSEFMTLVPQNSNNYNNYSNQNKGIQVNNYQQYTNAYDFTKQQNMLNHRGRVQPFGSQKQKKLRYNQLARKISNSRQKKAKNQMRLSDLHRKK